MKIKSIIFDADGTLTDSMGIWDDIAEKYLKLQGINPDTDVNTVVSSMSLPESAEYFQNYYGLKKSTDEIIAGVSQIVEDYYKFTVQLKKGVKEFLCKMQKLGIKMCIATATERKLINYAFERLGVAEYFEFILTCKEAGAGKTKPIIYEKAEKMLKTDRKEILVFEDTLYALETAKNDGFTTVGVYDSSEKNKDGMKNLADYYIEDFSEYEKISECFK